jgi:tubulin gamma
MNNDLVSILAALIPTPRLHFLMAGYTPFSFISEDVCILFRTVKAAMPIPPPPKQKKAVQTDCRFEAVLTSLNAFFK